MVYDYECQKCLEVHEEFHGMTEHPVIQCACGGKCVKLIATGALFCGVNGRADMYNFVDFNTTGQPVVINSKTQWHNHLKKVGLNDDVQNDPYTKAQVEAKVRSVTTKKDENRKKIKTAVVEAYKQRRSPAARQRVKEVLQKGGE